MTKGSFAYKASATMTRQAHGGHHIGPTSRRHLIVVFRLSFEISAAS
jgi:hypothetical protein